MPGSTVFGVTNIMGVRGNVSRGGLSRQFAYPFRVADDAMQMEVYKALCPFYTKKTPCVAATVHKMRFVGCNAFFHSCFFSHSIWLRWLLPSAVTVSLHYLPRYLRSTATCGKAPIAVTWSEPLLPHYFCAIKTSIRTIRSQVTHPVSAGNEEALVNCKLITAWYQGRNPLTPALATIVAVTLLEITRQLLKLESCSNHLRSGQVFQFRLK